MSDILDRLEKATAALQATGGHETAKLTSDAHAELAAARVQLEAARVAMTELADWADESVDTCHQGGFKSQGMIRAIEGARDALKLPSASAAGIIAERDRLREFLENRGPAAWISMSGHNYKCMTCRKTGFERSEIKHADCEWERCNKDMAALSPPPDPQVPLSQAFDELRAAGGDAWDKIEDVAAYLGRETPTPDPRAEQVEGEA